MWKQYAITIVAALALLGQHGAALAQQAMSANFVMPGCRDFINNTNNKPVLMGQCVGTDDGILAVGCSMGICVPNGAGIGHAIRVVTPTAMNPKCKRRDGTHRACEAHDDPRAYKCR
jgi:hypothetical protein